MTDKTLGAYQRHEKHDADDFANAEFARHPHRGIAARTRKGKMWAWIAGPMQELLRDEEMAAGGWSPVRECPDPEQHSDGLPDAVHALTKAVNDLHERAEKAEKERDKARGALRARLGVLAAESRPLAPDAITDEMVERARNAPSFDGRLSPTPRIVREMLTAALTEPPARPEGAEEIDEHLRQANAAALGGALTPEQRRALADHLAGFGYRSPIGLAEDGAA